MGAPAFNAKKPFISGKEPPLFDPSKAFEGELSQSESRGLLSPEYMPPGYEEQKRESIEGAPLSGAMLAGTITAPFGPAVSVPASGVGYAVGEAMKGFAENQEGYENAPSLKEGLTKAAYGVPKGMGLEATGLVGGKILEPVANKIGTFFSKFANKSIKNSTGATGKQASEFEENAGQQLIDRGIVKFGNSQEEIAANASKALDEANNKIDSALKALENKGIKINSNNIYNTVRSIIQDMKKDPSKLEVANQLEKELDNVVASANARGWKDQGILSAEKTKRGFNKKAQNWANPEAGQAGKVMYQAYRKEVENAARTADPEIAKTFEEAKKTYGLLAPIEEAAQKRAFTTAQSPPVGLLDTAAAAGGLISGGSTGAIVAPIARRLVAPRISSSLGISADFISKSVKDKNIRNFLIKNLTGRLIKNTNEK